MAKEAYYFSHDSNARHDPKITAMRSVYGSEGYGWFWILVEMMREADGYKLDMQGRYTFNAYAMQMHTECSTAEKFIHDCIHEFDLFESDGTHFWSRSLIRRMSLRDEVSEKKRRAALIRWEKQKVNADAMHMHSTRNASGMQLKENKLKENKSNKSKSNNHTSAPESEEESSHWLLGSVDPSESVMGSSSMRDPFGIFEKAFKGVLNEITAQSIQDMIDTYTREWVVKAMQKALTYGPDKHNISYVEGILKRWKRTGNPEPWTLEKTEPKPQANITPLSRSPDKPKLPVYKPQAPKVTDEQYEEILRKVREMDRRDKEAASQ